MASKENLQKLSEEVQHAVQLHSSTDDPVAYDNALAAMQKLQLAVEKPGDVAARVRFQGLQNIAIVMLGEMGVLQALAAEPDKEITADELAQKTNCDSVLIQRLLRLLTAVGICTETGPSTYRANAMTTVIASPGQLAGMRYMVELPFSIGSQIRSYMHSTQVHKGRPVTTNACEHAFGGKSFWQLLDDDADRRASFNEYMKAARRGGQAQVWVERYPSAAKLEHEELRRGEEAVLMVDVGGGVGGQVGAFRKQYPDLPGTCVLQDLPETIEKNTAPPEGVQLMGYDFFTPQPVRGARLYLFRSVCHDWDDANSIQLLRNTVAAMDPVYSRLLIDDWVVPDEGASLKAANMDVNMMLMFNAMERTKTQWTRLLDQAGLEIVDIFTTPGAAESIIETRVKQ